MTIDFNVINRHLLLQLGDRLRALRKARGMTAASVAEAAGISRMTLRSVESGDPGPSIGTYLAVMAILGVNQELALLAGDTFVPVVPGTSAARARAAPASVKLELLADTARHKQQDLVSLSLHEEAVSMLRKHPELVPEVRDTLRRWMTEQPASRSMPLWQEWQKILDKRAWSRVLSKTALAQQLRQASPLGSVVPAETRARILAQVNALKKGVSYVSATYDP